MSRRNETSSHHLRFSYLEWFPWAIEKESGNSSVIAGVTGELYEALANYGHFKYTLVPSPDGRYGTLDADGHWSGMVGLLQRNESDMVGPLVVSEKRSQISSFSNIFDSYELCIASGMVDFTENHRFLYLKVFSWQVWLLYVITWVTVSGVATLIGAVQHCRRNTHGHIFASYLWKFSGNLLQQGSTPHKAMSSIWASSSMRLLLGFWFLFPVVTFVLIFQGRMVSSFVVSARKPLISNLQQLIDIEAVVPVVTQGGFEEEFFRKSNDPLHLKIWERMEGNVIPANDFVVQHVLDDVERGTHVFISSNVYSMTMVAQRHFRTGRCGVHVSHETFGHTFISMALRKGLHSDVIESINNRVTRIVEAKIYEKWFSSVKDSYTNCILQHEDATNSLTAVDLEGVFILWSIGMLLAILVLITEILWDLKRRHRHLINRCDIRHRSRRH